MLRNERRVRDLFRRPRARRLALSLVMEHGDRIPAGEVSGLLDDLVGCTVFDAFVAELRQSTAGYAHDGRTIDCPVQIAWAGNDRTIPFSRYGRPWADALPEAKLVTLPGVGHVPMYDDPGLVADTILDLTRRTDSRRTPTPMNTTPEIHVHRWNGTPPSWIGVIAHGYGEHAGRYQHVARRFVADGAVVYAPDHRGHGLSPGERALVSDIEAIVDDLAGVVDAAKAEHPGLPVVLLGHSMGGIVATRYAQRTGSSTIDALVLTGPAIGGNPEIEGLLALDPIPDVPIDPAILSRDEAVQRAYAEDDLVYHGPFARASLEGMFGAVATIADGPRIEVPTLWIHGELDGLAPLEPTRAAIERVRPEAFDHEVYPGAMHEVLNEINRDEVLDRIAGFVQSNTR
jgi:alpha-beta hydrolase superfamily lysophospholipase